MSASPVGEADRRVTVPMGTAAGDGRASAGSREESPVRWQGEHGVNIRLSIPLGFSRCYLVVLGGRERRSRERQRLERLRHPLITTGNLLMLAGLGSAVGLAILALLQLLLGLVAHDIGMTVPSP